MFQYSVIYDEKLEAFWIYNQVWTVNLESKVSHEVAEMLFKQQHRSTIYRICKIICD